MPLAGPSMWNIAEERVMSDIYDDLPADPESGTPDASSASLSVDAVKAAISAKLYEELTDGDDAVTERCIESATVRAQGFLLVVGKTLDLSVPLHRDIARLLSVYELFVYNGDAKGGNEYLVAATDLVSVHYGDVGKARETPPPTGAVSRPERRALS